MANALGYTLSLACAAQTVGARVSLKKTTQPSGEIWQALSLFLDDWVKQVTCRKDEQSTLKRSKSFAGRCL